MKLLHPVLCLFFLAAGPVGAGDWVFLELCRGKTGQPLDKDMFEALGHAGNAWVNTADIHIVTAHHKHEGCSYVTLRNGSQALVIGSPFDLACMMSNWPLCEKLKENDDSTK